MALYSCVGARPNGDSNNGKVQIYPNPFSPSTAIVFTTKTAQPVLITLFDIKGNPIDTVFHGISVVGNNIFVPKMDSLPSGVYLYRYTSQETSYTRKMMYMK